MNIKILIFIKMIILLILIKINSDSENYSDSKFYRSEVVKSIMKSIKKLSLRYEIRDRDIIVTHNNKVLVCKTNGGTFYKDREKTNHINSEKSMIISENKFKCLSKLKSFNLPIPETYFYSENINFDNYTQILNNPKIKYPCVVKIPGGYGGFMVFIDIKNREELKQKIIIMLKKKQNKIMVEQYITGNNYRIICYKDKILDIVSRGKMVMVGDGINNLRNLIEIENAKRKKIDFYLITEEKKKYKDDKKRAKFNENFLKKKYNINLDFIPIKNQKIILDNLNTGISSIPIRIKLKDVHLDNLRMFKKINSILNLNFIGIDFISPDISKSYLDPKVTSGINEINSHSPSLENHYWASEEYSSVVSDGIYKNYFNL